MAFSLIGIFIPAFLLNLGYDLTQIILWAVGLYISWIIASFIVPYVTMALGYKKTILWRSLLVFAFFLILYNLQFSKLPLYSFSIITGLMWAFYWTPMNAFFASHADSKHEGVEIGFIMLIARVAGIVGPLIGAFILSSLGGLSVLLVVASIIFATSLVPLLWSKDQKPKSLNWNKFVATEQVHFLFLVFEGTLYIGLGFFLPLYVFLEFGGFGSVGVVGALFALASAIVGLVVGKWFDSGHKDVFKIGVVLTSILSVLLFATQAGVVTFILIFLIGISSSPIHVAITTHYFQRSRKLPVIGIAMREVFLCIGRLIPLGIFLATGLSFKIIFLSVGILSLPLLFLKT